MVRPLYAPHLLGVYAAHTVKKAVRAVPVFAVHRILTPEEAEGVLEREEADAVTLVRALIADPDWVAKAQTGASPTIRRCTGSNQGCYGNLLQGLPVTCVQNPAVGREAELGHGTWVRAATRPTWPPELSPRGKGDAQASATSFRVRHSATGRRSRSSRA